MQVQVVGLLKQVPGCSNHITVRLQDGHLQIAAMLRMNCSQCQMNLEGAVHACNIKGKLQTRIVREREAR